MSGVKGLSGDLAGWYRLRTGDYRVRFRLQGETIVVDKIGHRKLPRVKTLNVNGKTMVMLEKAEYDRLRSLADEGPPLPLPDADGHYPAVATLRIGLARKIIRRRRAAGLTQAELARRAGIRVETLCRLEAGKHTPTLATIEKIERALESVFQSKEVR